MTRGRTFVLPLAVICLIAAACGRLAPSRSAIPSTPDPGTAVALSVLGRAVYLVDPVSGVQAEVIGGLADFQDGYAVWAPGHTQLAFADHGIYLLDLAVHRRRLLVAGTGMSMPAWSPSGQVMAYGNGASLWITPLFDQQPLQLSIPATLAPVDMDWSGSGIAFEGIRRDCARSYLCPTTDESDIFTIQADAHDLSQVTHIRTALAPKWSPDGLSILFVRRFEGDRQELWVVGADGSNPHEVGTAGDVLAADWSPDGRQIAIARRGAETSTVQLWIAAPDGSIARPVGAPVQGTDVTVDW